MGVASSVHAVEHVEIKRCIYRFCKEYFGEPWRGYGGSVVRIFQIWKDKGIDDPFQLAQEQFDGKGSFGNGAAMRIAPVALYGYNAWELAEKVSYSICLPVSVCL